MATVSFAEAFQNNTGVQVYVGNVDDDFHGNIGTMNMPRDRSGPTIAAIEVGRRAASFIACSPFYDVH